MDPTTQQAPAPSQGGGAADIKKAGKNKAGMLIILRATLKHIFGLEAEQIDAVIKHMRSIGVTTMDMGEEFVTTNQNALYMLKQALQKEIAQEEKEGGEEGGAPQAQSAPGAKAAPDATAVKMEHMNNSLRGKGKSLLTYFNELQGK